MQRIACLITIIFLALFAACSEQAKPAVEDIDRPVVKASEILPPVQLEPAPVPPAEKPRSQNSFIVDSDIIIADFENPDEVLQWCDPGNADNYKETALTNKHVLNGDTALHVTFNQKQYPGITLHRDKLETRMAADWSGREVLKFAVYAEQNVGLNIRIDDVKSTGYATRYNNDATILVAGWNYIQIPIELIAKHIDVCNINLVCFFILKPTEDITLIFDYTAVGRRDPNIEKRSMFARLEKLPTDAVFSNDIATPHVQWLKPYYAGPINAVFVPTISDGRDVIEVAQRLECAYDVVAVSSERGTNRWGYGDMIKAREKDEYILWSILKKLEDNPDTDVLVMNRGLGWSRLPEMVKKQIMARVEHGMGLVLINPGMSYSRADRSDASLEMIAPLINAFAKTENITIETVAAHPIVNGIPFEAWPLERSVLWDYKLNPAVKAQAIVTTDAGSPFIAVGSYGQGRIVQFGFDDAGLIPKTDHGHFIADEIRPYRYWETQYALAARAIAWAAGKEPRIAVDLEVTAPADPGGRSGYTAEVLVRPAVPGACIADITVRDEQETVLQQQSIPLIADQAGASAVFSLPVLHYGMNFVDVRCLMDGRVENSASHTVVIDRPATISSVAGINNERVYAVNDILIPAITIVGKADAVKVELVDGYERVAASAQGTVNDVQMRVPITVKNYLSALCRLRISLLKDGLIIDRHSQLIYTAYNHPGYDDYRIGISGGSWKYPFHEFLPDIFRSFNVVKLNYSNQEAARGFIVEPHSRTKGIDPRYGEKKTGYYYKKWFEETQSHYRRTKDKQYLVKTPCLSDPAYLAELKAQYISVAQKSKQLSCKMFSVGDENSLTYLRQEIDFCYSPHCLEGFREYLQEEYQTIGNLNRSWKSNYTSFGEAMPLTIDEAQAQQNFAPWADHRTFMETVFVRTLAFVKAAICEVIPDAEIALSGTQISTSFNGLDWYQIDRIIGGMSPYSGGSQDYIHAAFQKGAINACTGYGQKGPGLFHQIWSRIMLGHTSGQSVFWRYEVLNPDGTFSESGADLRDIFLEIRGRGIGKLLQGAALNNGGIALHYSIASLHAARTVNAESSFTANWKKWTSLLSETGYQFRFTAYKEIEDDVLINDSYKILIMPRSAALSNKEVERIQAFIDKGGMVLADRMPGTLDDHCVKRIDPPFDSNAITVIGELPDDTDKPTSSTDAFRACMAASSITPAFTVSSGEKPLQQAILSRFDDGDVSYFGILKDIVGFKREYLGDGTELFTQISDTLPSEAVRLDFKRKGHIYDIRTGEYLGEGSTAAAELQSAGLKLFAVVPYKVDGVEIDAPETADADVPIAVSVRIRAVSPWKAAHVFRIQITGPDGKRYYHYEKNIRGIDGQASHTFQLAGNDPRGTWTIQADDVVSSSSAQCSITFP